MDTKSQWIVHKKKNLTFCYWYRRLLNMTVLQVERTEIHARYILEMWEKFWELTILRMDSHIYQWWFLIFLVAVVDHRDREFVNSTELKSVPGELPLDTGSSGFNSRGKKLTCYISAEERKRKLRSPVIDSSVNVEKWHVSYRQLHKVNGDKVMTFQRKKFCLPFLKLG